MFKPDETAEGRAVGIARRTNPAADQNAQSIVIHPLHRPGAPGIEPQGPAGPGRARGRLSHEHAPIDPPGPGLRSSSRRPAAARPRRPRPTSPRRPRPWSPRRCRRATVPDVKFVEITEAAGLELPARQRRQGDKLLPETMGSGAAFFDYDGDGDPDLFLVNSTPWPGAPAEPRPTHALYRNDGRGHFEDVTKEAGLAQTVVRDGRGRRRLRQRRRPRPLRHRPRRQHPLPERRPGALRGRDRRGQRRGADGWCTSRHLLRHGQRRRPRPLRLLLRRLVAPTIDRGSPAR